MSKSTARHWLYKIKSLLLFLTPSLVLIIGVGLSILVFARLHQSEVETSRKENSQKVQDIARQIDLLISNSLLRVQSYEEYLGPREVNYPQETTFIRQALKYTVFQRLSIFRSSGSKKSKKTSLKRIASIEETGINLPKSHSNAMQSQVLLQVIKNMKAANEYQQAAFFNLNDSSIFSVVLHSKFHDNIYFVFLTSIEKIFEPINLQSSETIFLTDTNSNRNWAIYTQGNKLKITPADSEDRLKEGKQVISFNKEMAQSGLPLKFDFIYANSSNDVASSLISLILCLTLTIIISFLFWLLVSQNKRTTRLVIERTHDLERAHHLTQEALMFKTRFIGNISHEIRTPLNMILGMVDLCEEEDVDAKIHEYLRNMRTSGNHLLEMIEDLLDLAKIETSDLHFQYKPINLVQFLDEIGRIVGQECEKKHLKMHMSFDPHIPTAIKCDPSRLRQVLLNLLKNACKYTSNGFVSLNVRIEASTDPDKKHFIFEVRDSGIGIAPEQIGHIFEAFVQIENSHALSEGGVGLGLSIVKDLVKKLNGQIHVSSHPQDGSLFTVELDLEVSDSVPWVEKYRHPTEKTQTLFLVLSDSRTIDAVSRLAAHTNMRIELVPPQQVDRFIQNYKKNPNHWVIIEPLSPLHRNHPLFQVLDLSRTLLLGNRSVLRENFKDLPVEILNDSPLIMNDLLTNLGFSSRKKPRPQESAQMQTSQAEAYKSMQKNISIIVADDDDGNRELVKAYLDKTPWDITFTMNGLEAWESYLKSRADLMIVDGRMPIMDGFSLIEKIRGHETENSLPSCPIILITADALEQTERRAKAFKDVTYMTKPLRKGKLLDAIEQTQH